MAGNASGGETRNLAGRRPGVWSGGATQGSVPERHDVEAGKPETTSPAETSKRAGGAIRGLQDVLSGSNDDPGSPGGFIRVKRQGLTPLAFFFVRWLGVLYTFHIARQSPSQSKLFAGATLMKSSFRLIPSAVLALVLCVLGSPLARAQFAGAPSPLSAYSVPTAHLMQPAELVRLLGAKNTTKPLMLQVGSRMMFAQAHIPGSEYIGPGAQPAGIEQLKARVAKVDRKAQIVLYCGCCPWNRCPNVGPAYQALTDMGFTHVQVLYFANNFGADWVEKGYPVASGQ